MAGCMSQVPYPTTYPMTLQNKMQAADHWRVLASDISQSITTKLNTDSSFYINRDSEEPFEKFLADFLEQQLIEKGYTLTTMKGVGTLPIDIDARVLEHSDRYMMHPPGTLTALTSSVWVARDIALYGSTGGAAAATIAGAAALDYASGLYTGPLSHKEVIVSVKIIEDQKILLANNSIYYINEAESWHYDSSPYTQNRQSKHDLKSKSMTISGE